MTDLPAGASGAPCRHSDNFVHSVQISDCGLRNEDFPLWLRASVSPPPLFAILSSCLTLYFALQNFSLRPKHPRNEHREKLQGGDLKRKIHQRVQHDSSQRKNAGR